MCPSNNEPPLPPPGQLRWRCRRGMRELDVLLTRFLDHQWDELPESLKPRFVELLEVQDPVLMDWIMGRSEPPVPEFVVLVETLRTPIQN